jgi:hypothetical protein
LNLLATLNAYEQRIRSLPQSELEELSGVWLSSYDNWDTVEAAKMDEEVNQRSGVVALDNHTIRLFQVAVERGIDVKGITSERQTGGTYLAEIPLEGGRASSDVLYVGGHNSFTHKASSKWSICPVDKRYDN